MLLGMKGGSIYSHTKEKGKHLGCFRQAKTYGHMSPYALDL